MSLCRRSTETWYVGEPVDKEIPRIVTTAEAGASLANVIEQSSSQSSACKIAER